MCIFDCWRIIERCVYSNWWCTCTYCSIVVTFLRSSLHSGWMSRPVNHNLDDCCLIIYYCVMVLLLGKRQFVRSVLIYNLDLLMKCGRHQWVMTGLRTYQISKWKYFVSILLAGFTSFCCIIACCHEVQCGYNCLLIHVFYNNF